MQFIDLLNVRELRSMFEKRFRLEQELEVLRQELERVKQQRDALAEGLEQSRTLVSELNSRLLALEALDRLDEARTHSEH
jgi:septal ring factor EnvC (AmiA/AmiB activator)